MSKCLKIVCHDLIGLNQNVFQSSSQTAISPVFLCRTRDGEVRPQLPTSVSHKNFSIFKQEVFATGNGFTLFCKKLSSKLVQSKFLCIVVFNHNFTILVKCSKMICAYLTDPWFAIDLHFTCINIFETNLFT